MPKRLAKIKRTFFLYQVIILLSAMGLFFGIIANGYIKNAKTEIQAKQDKVTGFIVDYIRRGEDVPEIAKEFYTYFILDAKDGSYVVKRKDALEESGLFWETFHVKLTYQMQKQRNGTIVYPTKKPREIFKSSKILRYTTLSDLGWIVVTETDLPSEWSLIKKITTKNDLFNLLLGIFVGFIILKFITDGYFVRLESQISDAHEYSLGNFNQNIGKNFKRSSKSTKPFFVAVPEADKQEMVKKAETKFKMNFSQNALGAEPNERIPEEPKEYSGDRSEFEEEALKPQRIQEVKKEYVSPVEKEEKRNPENVQEIKSPVLRKMLEELRKHKRKG